MNEYKIYLFDEYGHIRRSIDVARSTDEEAIAEAQIFASDHGLELWKGGQKVAAFDGSGHQPSRRGV